MFWIFNIIFNLKYLVVSVFCIGRHVQKDKRTALSHPFILSIKESRISDPIQIALILLDLQLNIEILQVTHVMD